MELLLIAAVTIGGVLYMAFRGDASRRPEDEEGGYEVTRFGAEED